MLRLAAILFAVAAGCNRQAQHAPDVWAVVNGKEIKREEIDKYYRTRVNPEGQEPSQEEALSLKLNVLDELINNEILLERAKKLNLEASDGEVEERFRSAIRTFLIFTTRTGRNSMWPNRSTTSPRSW